MADSLYIFNSDDMKNFLIYIMLLIAPLLLVIMVLEMVATRIPNSYSYKYNYVKTHGDSIRVLVMGHSQLYDGFDAKVFGKGSFNMCNSSQEFIDDYYILRKLLNDMPNLRIVIMPIGYSDVSSIDSKFELSERSTYYKEYMHIDYDGQLPFKYWFEGINIPKAFSKVYEYYVKHEDIVGCDSLGRRNMYDSEDRNRSLEDNKVISKYYTLNQNTGFVLRGELFLEMIQKMLKEKDIYLVLVSTPYFYDSISYLNIKQQAFVDAFTTRFSKKEGVLYLNYQSSPDFDEEDFYDEAHLSKAGAEKFTKTLKENIPMTDICHGGN